MKKLRLVFIVIASIIMSIAPLIENDGVKILIGYAAGVLVGFCATTIIKEYK